MVVYSLSLALIWKKSVEEGKKSKVRGGIRECKGSNRSKKWSNE